MSRSLTSEESQEKGLRRLKVVVVVAAGLPPFSPRILLVELRGEPHVYLYLLFFSPSCVSQ